MNNKREQLLDWVGEHDEYEFLWDENSSEKHLKKIKITIQKLDKILEQASKKIHKLEKSKEGKCAGIGDTATDEAIVGELYNLIH